MTTHAGPHTHVEGECSWAHHFEDVDLWCSELVVVGSDECDGTDHPHHVVAVRPLTQESCYRERIVVARKAHGCDDYPRCRTGIAAGERYVLCTTFPGHDSGYATQAGRPMRARLCAAHSLGRIAPLDVSLPVARVEDAGSRPQPSERGET